MVMKGNHAVFNDDCSSSDIVSVGANDRCPSPGVAAMEWRKPIVQSIKLTVYIVYHGYSVRCSWSSCTRRWHHLNYSVSSRL